MSRIAAESQQVLKPQLARRLCQQFRRAYAHHLVAQGPQSVEPHGLMPGGVDKHVCVFAARLEKIIIKRAEG